MKFKPVVNEFRRSNLGNITSCIMAARENLLKIQILMSQNCSNIVLYKEESEAQSELRKWLLVEENVAKQEDSRISWLKVRDDNTKYFNKAMKDRWARNRIKGTNDSRAIVDTPSEIESVLVDFYKKLLGTSSFLRAMNSEVMRRGNTVSRDDIIELIIEVSKAEIDNAMKLVDDDKSLRIYSQF